MDSCIPRTPKERCDIVFQYLVEVSSIGPHADLDPVMHDGDPDAEEWGFLEDKILEGINDRLPDSLVCTVGEFQPGDVIVREIGEDDGQEAV